MYMTFLFVDTEHGRKRTSTFRCVADMLQVTPWSVRENNSAKSPQELWDNVSSMRRDSLLNDKKIAFSVFAAPVQSLDYRAGFPLEENARPNPLLPEASQPSVPSSRIIFWLNSMKIAGTNSDSKED